MSDTPGLSQFDDREIRELLDLLLARIQGILGHKLAGLYLHGSLASGNFDPGISDLDLVAALLAFPEAAELAQLKTMHMEISEQYQKWDDRIEVAYMPVAFLKGSNLPCEAAVISPGEPFHVVEVRPEQWVLNRYSLLKYGVVLTGPLPDVLVRPVSQADMLACVREHCRQWPEWVQHMRHRGGQAYSILTMCRALYTVSLGDFVSKKQAALWAQQELPFWKPLIQQALAWRGSRNEDRVDDPVAFIETVKFVNFVVDQVLNNVKQQG